MLVTSHHNSFRVLFDKIASVHFITLFEKYIHILALEMASPGNRHCANCIGALLFSMSKSVCLSVCLHVGEHVSGTQVQSSPKFLCMLPTAVL